MIKKIFIIFFLLCTVAHSQENLKINNLGAEINLLNDKILELKEQINTEIRNEGFILTVKKRSKYSKLHLKKKKFGETIDTIKEGQKIKIIGKEIGAYKVKYKNKIGYLDSFVLKLEDSSALNYLKYKSENKGYSGSTKSNYVKGYFRKTKSGKRVYVKGHYRKN
ncbi:MULTISPECIES: hypothetical protein [unclassified Tenacibaculum]|uniref:hypothetical protein n=1 Tax=unclassified Tenacibaculum TaxID=2635139 RepID=UPI001F3BE59B|nr:MULTISPECIES: hypothetical protein [unclassified Tenacibaculum]MCF2875445.1 hypothetical protein [Tenacibaculum sp. Cn5-1]MCF2935521.1 hypothetical protein [Tenacibaculum sp. Cn5-34]MCG7512081.1 hypothetical protein [Tenacibaculum sp. Cn5-46]